MLIYLKKRGSIFVAPRDSVYPFIVLQWDNWNDYSYSTLFMASIYRERDVGALSIGAVKIQRFGQTTEGFTFPLELVGPFSLDQNDAQYCSLGVAEKYYETLVEINDPDLVTDYLESMCDASFDSTIRSLFQDDSCFKISLLRDLDSRKNLDEAGALFGRNASLVNSFSAMIHLPGATAAHNFNFDFSSFHGLPHRLHALVGLNGVGKTQVMARLAILMSRFSKKSQKEKTSTLGVESMLSPVPSIYNVVAISFSAFDEFERPTILQGEKFRYSYCGLRSQRGKLLTEEDLLANIRRIVTDELDEEKRVVLAATLSDIIRVDDIQSFVNDPEVHTKLYERLSAGQRIALNALCHTLAKLEPRTLVLFDEPELHLHPQLLTTMITAFMGLLNRYDSFAIIATHSPIVIQQIPSRCTHIVRRDRMMPMVFRPKLEFFGETLTEITRNVFLTTESDRDYRHTLDKILIENNNNVEVVEAIFEGKLSMNARIYLESRRDSMSSE
jgi:predicted ATPase